MHVTIESTLLVAALQRIVRFISSKPQLPILSSFACIARHGEIECIATDLHVGIREKIPTHILQEGNCVIPAKIFLELVNSLPSTTVELVLEGTTLHLNTTETHAEITCFSFEDFPPFPQKEGVAIHLASELFTETAHAVVFAASSDESRPILTSVLLLLGEKTTTVCTDGYRLAIYETKTPNTSSQRLLLPAKSVAEIARIILQSGVDTVEMTVSEGLKQAFFSFGSFEIVLRVLDGDFPNFHAIIPAACAIQFSCEKKLLETAIKTALLFTRESSSVVKFQVEHQSVQISAHSTALGKYVGTIPLEYSGPEAQIAFNGRYVLDFLQRVKDETITFGMNESLKPAVFSPSTSAQLQYVVMPFRVTE